ncbi:MAG: hypothetical protein METHAR1v1_1050021 [Methanothrix sp.]|nr:MAG: hypothetical protein METHAR1v1_1050021 [Methanothrix sp.]
MPESKISVEILEMIQKGSKRASEEKVRVIISLEKGASLEDARRDLAEGGLEIENAVSGPIPFVSGAISIDGVSRVAALPAVKKVEQDSEIHAL